ncbi:Dabb family protein [Parenemella sanctibonifatiensis]|nr:Dabb family protein [Parenemella sanctibonifatiensis]
MAIQHIVLIDLAGDVTAEDSTYLTEAVGSWGERIGLATEARIGADTSGRAGEWDFLLYTVFPTQADLEAYAIHPVHLEFVAWLDQRGSKRMAFDYEI